MEVLKIIAEGVTTSFRYPHFIQEFSLLMKCLIQPLFTVIYVASLVIGYHQRNKFVSFYLPGEIDI